MTHLTHAATAAALALAANASLALAGAGTSVTTFSLGDEGWSGPSGIGGATTIEPTGGNPSHNMHTVFNDFGITFANSTNPAWARDYSAFASATFSIDTKVNNLNFFGQDVSRPWLIELRDYDNVSTGAPWVSVWYKFTDISEAAHSDWTTFSVTIADTGATTLPAGWGGYGDEDPMTFEPLLPADRTFADVLAGVDEVVFTTFEPGFFFGFTDHDVQIDNLRVSVTPAPGAAAPLAGLALVGLGRRRRRL